DAARRAHVIEMGIRRNARDGRHAAAAAEDGERSIVEPAVERRIDDDAGWFGPLIRRSLRAQRPGHQQAEPCGPEPEACCTMMPSPHAGPLLNRGSAPDPGSNAARVSDLRAAGKWKDGDGCQRYRRWR